jgi:hypothetical protein
MDMNNFYLDEIKKVAASQAAGDSHKQAEEKYQMMSLPLSR